VVKKEKEEFSAKFGLCAKDKEAKEKELATNRLQLADLRANMATVQKENENLSASLSGCTKDKSSLQATLDDSNEALRICNMKRAACDSKLIKLRTALGKIEEVAVEESETKKDCKADGSPLTG